MPPMVLALELSALEAFEGPYEAEELGEMVEQAQILETAMGLIIIKIKTHQTSPPPFRLHGVKKNGSCS